MGNREDADLIAVQQRRTREITRCSRGASGGSLPKCLDQPVRVTLRAQAKTSERVLEMLILGVNTGPHDGSAALLQDGVLLVMIEEERLSRHKRAVGESPARAALACLDAVGAKLDDVDEVAVGWNVPLLAQRGERQFNVKRFRQWLFPEDLFPGAEIPPFRFVPHHIAHAASAFWTSGAEDAAIIVMDGMGEAEATTIAVGASSEIKLLSQWDTLRSLGFFYEYAAEWAGLSSWEPGKLMGLAAYGQPDQPPPIVCTTEGYDVANRPGMPGPDQSNYSYLRSILCESFNLHNYPYGPGTRNEPMAHAHFAASIQRTLETVVMKLVEIARESTQAEQLVLAGGVALNCTMNGLISRSSGFSDVYIPPVPHDAGVSLGAALVAFQDRGISVPTLRLKHAFWGPEQPRSEVTSALRDAGLTGIRLSRHEMAARVAEELVAGRMVGWWQGRSEVGQRALGARSILCDPRTRRNLAHLNMLKGREVWRPLAPSVLDDSVRRVFGRELPSSADFMLSAWPVTAEAQRLIPAAVHVDGSARPQVVRKETTPRFWEVIDAFRQSTGVPAVINTSFNLAGEPNVQTAADAISTFIRGGLDVLAIDDILVRNQPDLVFKYDTTARTLPEMNLFPWDTHASEA
jgi:carbamoyltransferase